MDKELEKFSIDVASFEIVPEEYSDSQLAVVEIYVRPGIFSATMKYLLNCCSVKPNTLLAFCFSLKCFP